jgi:hypothetical protein
MMRTGYIVFVKRWVRGGGARQWESIEYRQLWIADEYAEQAVQAGRARGEKVVACVWQTEDGNPQTNLYAHEQRSAR